MKCTDFEQMINEYADGELKHSIEALEEHMATCDECRALYEETMELKNLLADMEEVALPDDFEMSLHEKLVAVANEKQVIPFYKNRHIKALASVAAVAVVSILILQTGDLFKMGSNNDEAAYDSAFLANDADMDEAAADTEMAYGDALEEDMMDDGAEESVGVAMAEPESMLRFTMKEQALATEEVHIDLIAEDLLPIINYVEVFDIKDLQQAETLTFYIHTEDFKDFIQGLEELFLVKSQVALDYSANIEELQAHYAKQSERVADLSEDADDETVAYEKGLLNELKEQLGIVTTNEGYKYIVIRLNEE